MGVRVGVPTVIFAYADVLMALSLMVVMSVEYGTMSVVHGPSSVVGRLRVRDEVPVDSRLDNVETELGARLS